MNPKHNKHRRLGRGQSGVALIEALVGMLIFAFGVLGLVGLQASMTKAQTASKYRADAGNLASELLGQMWSDAPAQVPSYASGTCASYQRCKDWLGKVQNSLPGAATTVTVSQVSPVGATALIYQVQIQVTWNQAGEQGGHSYTTVARVEPG